MLHDTKRRQLPNWQGTCPWDDSGCRFCRLVMHALGLCYNTEDFSHCVISAEDQRNETRARRDAASVHTQASLDAPCVVSRVPSDHALVYCCNASSTYSTRHVSHSVCLALHLSLILLAALLIGCCSYITTHDFVSCASTCKACVTHPE